MASSFPLRRLPYCAFKSVLDHFDPHELLIISICSQRAKRLVKSSKFSAKNVKLQLFIAFKSVVVVRYRGLLHSVINVYETPSLPEKCTIGRIGDFSVPMDIGKYGELNTYWPDRLLGMEKVGEYCKEILDQSMIQYLSVGTEISKDDPKWALDWINSSQNTLSSVHFAPQSELNDEQISYLLSNCRITQQFSFQVKPSDSFQYTGTLPSNLNYLNINPSKWVTREHLLSIDSELICLRETRFTNQDINIFLKHWLSGGCSKLKEIRIEVQGSVDSDIVTGGIETGQRNARLVRRYKNQDALYLVRGGLDIINGEITATILQNIGEPNLFWMFVWPDYDGNSF